MSLYGDYIKERLGDGIIENENGFATYRFLNDKKTIYIVDIYVVPEKRKTKVASDLADEIVKIGKQEGANELIGTVSISANNSTSSLSVLIGYGMKLQSASDNFIIFRKEI